MSPSRLPWPSLRQMSRPIAGSHHTTYDIAIRLSRDRDCGRNPQ
jgi:hypothetical protein